MKKIISQKIIIDGETYRSIEDLPSELREQYGELLEHAFVDTDNNGTPDIFEGAQGEAFGPSEGLETFITSRQSFTVSGIDQSKSPETGQREAGLFKKPSEKKPDGDAGNRVRALLVTAALIMLILF